jgi:putative ATPase
MRPTGLDEIAGQHALLGADGLLRRLLRAGELPSLILWGPPGSGKTTLARLLAAELGAAMVAISGATSKKSDLEQAVELARFNARSGRRTVLFVDEIHRFNKAQQDGFLPHVESGVVTMIGATTENPSFEVIAPLLSRCRVLTLDPLDDAALTAILARALDDPRGLAGVARLDDTLRARLVGLAAGDARKMLVLTELLVAATTPDADGVRRPDATALGRLLERDALAHDKGGDRHYDTISALHKSVRDSDADAALYWLARMLEAGEDPRFLVRRLVRMASEDIGLADPQALVQAVATLQAWELLGRPEGELALAQLTVYLALAPKSNAIYLADKAARATVRRSGALPVPLVMRNAPTALMQQLGFGGGYQYAHDAPDACVIQQHRPTEVESERYYHPIARGFEVELQRRLRWWEQRRATPAAAAERPEREP